MALSVNTNVTSLTVQKNLNKAGDALSTSMTRLSSGLKINSAKDDAAGLQMANRLTSQTKGMTVAIANANNGSSIAQTAEGAMQESTNILQRLRELALQASNGDKSADDRAALQQEFTAKTGELTRIAQTTTFGGRNILDGSFQNQSFQVGADANQAISFGMSDISAASLKGTSSEATVAGTKTSLSASVTGQAVSFPGAGSPVVAGLVSAADIKINGTTVKFTATMASVEDLADEINKATADAAGPPAVVGTGVTAAASADGTRLELTSADGKAIKLENGDGAAGAGALAKVGLTAGTSAPKLADASSINLNGTDIKFAAGSTMADVVSSINSASTGVTASLKDDGTLSLFSTKDIKVGNGGTASGLKELGLDGAVTATNKGVTAAISQESSVADLSILDANSAQKTIQALSGAIEQIDTQRAALGAVQNRFDSTVANLQSISENSTAALGRVQDTDFASEAAQLTKQQTLQQASTAILSQANQLPSAVMKLLQ
ncbi:flagellin N-terminal helical domain-containing protein [Pseudomonas helleri]|uniref:Flagellin n=1 Tax=Pseudomonas helleri TaxID=1608996 RepID=A0A6L5I052_9PSED|nr:flagellin [Pseudomonas helleri]MQU09016.1 flagellin [Pseudomonas helleri]